MRSISRIAIAGLVAWGILAGALPASAATSRASSSVVTRSGSCTGTSTWTLKVKPDAPGRIETDLEVETKIAGQRWRSRFRDNGVLFGHGVRTTKADGSFSITRFATDGSGTDAIRVRSVNLSTAEVCTATAAL